jgi:cellulose synthase/poly-beta-1,6-N-acetylglucosamine synthase-like glycosyltransferase
MRPELVFEMRPELIAAVFLTYALCLAVLSTFGLNRYILVTLFRRRLHHEKGEPLPESSLPVVTIQLPIYNELYVVERLIRSACELDYPSHLLEIQVLDDSTDETLELARRLVREYRRKGIDVVHLHRTDRAGFKGGALAHGLERARGEFVAVFDADFLIPRSFLRDTLPHFTSADVGMVQTRWTYLNDDYSLLTRAAALGLDGHFVVEQSARYWGGLFLNFNGTAGIWRARCIEAAGGWQHDTLTEDLDLSYRAQIAGWRFKYLWDVTCDSEIPAEIHGMKAQQFRWTKGSMETARKLLPRLWKSKLPRWIKVQGTLHLLGNIVFPFFLTVGILNMPIVLAASQFDYRLPWLVSAYFLFTLFGTFSFYWTAQRATNMNWRRRAAYFPLFLGASIGLGVNNTQACLEGLFGKRSAFERTPKYNLIGKYRNWRDKRYRSPVTWTTAVELLLGLYTLVTIGVAIRLREYGGLPFLFLFAFGYLMVAGYSLKHLAWKAPKDVDGATPRTRPRLGKRRHALRREPVATALPMVAALFLLLSCGGAEKAEGTREGVVEVVRAQQTAVATAVPQRRPQGFEELELVERDSIYQVVPAAPGGSHGVFWYNPTGRSFEWFVRAEDLRPARAYRMLLNVDGKTYAIASLLADPKGELRGYGSLDTFRELICVRHSEFDDETPIVGTHEIGVWIQDDGAKVSGPGDASGLPMRPVGRSGRLPCAGNGDNSWELRLTESAAVRFQGL